MFSSTWTLSAISLGSTILTFWAKGSCLALAPKLIWGKIGRSGLGMLSAGNRGRGIFIALEVWQVNNIGKLKDFLLQHRKDYINAYSHFMSEYVRMSDTDRDQIDQDAQIFMRTCADAIQQLRAEAHKDIHSPQVKQHRETVLDFIADYLKKRNLVDEHADFGLGQDSRGEDELSPEEIQMFEQENQRLVGEMNSLFDEVRQIEGKVVEISRLQEIFTEKVLQQEAEIDNIHQIVVGATENIKEGNEDIREAIKNNAGFRVWILFFLVMCSFSLLFLDWFIFRLRLHHHLFKEHQQRSHYQHSRLSTTALPASPRSLACGHEPQNKEV
ncbi:hypothetical protein E2320_008074 [Naja naja]|nr:hypothetical protein E2320_008074 [Naja naja]